jgi:VPDSG-CTERM motif
VKKFLAFVFVAIAFAVNANAYYGPVAAVPDTGSTLLLLGTALSALAFFRRR